MTRPGSAAGWETCTLALVGLLLLCCLAPAAPAAACPHASSSDSRSISRPTIQPGVAHAAGSSWWQQDPSASPPRHNHQKQRTKLHLAGQQPCDQTLSLFVDSSTEQHSFVRWMAGGFPRISFLARLSSSTQTQTQQAAGALHWWQVSGGATNTAPCPDPVTPHPEPWHTPQQLLDPPPPPLGTHTHSTSHQHQHHHHHHQQQQQHQQQRRRPVAAAARRLLWGRRLRQLDLKLLQSSSAADEVQKDVIRLQQIQGGDANLRLAYVQYGLYYLLTCGGFNSGQDVAAAAAAYRALPGSNPQYAAAGLVQLRLQLLEEILPRATSAGRRNVEECEWYYNTLAPDVSPAFTLQGLRPNANTAPAPQNASGASPSPLLGASPSPSPSPTASPSPSPQAASSPSPSPSASSNSPESPESPEAAPPAPNPTPESPAAGGGSGSGSGGSGGQGGEEEAGAAPGFFWNGSEWVPVSSGLPPPGGVVMGVPSGGMPAGGDGVGSVVGR